MMNLSEMFANPQGTAAMQALAQQFGLSQTQAEEAVAALLPAFSVGMQQQAKSLEAFQNLVGSFGTGQHLAAFEYPAMAMTQPMMQAGSDFIRQIFGGTHTSAQEIQNEVVRQAAGLTGIGTSILSNMLPIVASMILGGLFKGAMTNGLGGLLDQMLRGGGSGGGVAFPQQNHAPEPGAQPSSNPFGDLLSSIFGVPGSNPNPPASDPLSAGIDMLKGMFQTGQEIQAKQVETMENIFNEVLNSQKK